VTREQVTALIRPVLDGRGLRLAVLFGSGARDALRPDSDVDVGDKKAALIQSAGFAVRKTTASAGHRASYDWEYSADGGKTWVLLPSTLQAKTSVTGLAAGTTVQFLVK